MPEVVSTCIERRETPLRRLIPGLTGLCRRIIEFRCFIARKLFTISSADCCAGGGGRGGTTKFCPSADDTVPAAHGKGGSGLLDSGDGRLRRGRGRDMNASLREFFADFERLFSFCGCSSMLRHSREWEELKRLRSSTASLRRFGSDPLLGSGRDLVGEHHLAEEPFWLFAYFVNNPPFFSSGWAFSESRGTGGSGRFENWSCRDKLPPGGNTVWLEMTEITWGIAEVVE